MSPDLDRRRKELERREIAIREKETRQRELELERRKSASVQASRGKSAFGGGHPRLSSTSILPESAEVRVLDTIIAAGGSIAVVAFTATRPHDRGSDILWAMFWDAMGAFMAIEGRGNALKYSGFGLVGACTSYLFLRLVGGIEPQVLAVIPAA